MTLMMRAALALIAAGLLVSAAQAATQAEEASAAANEWAKAVMARDVDTQAKLLPPGLFAKADERERDYKRRLHDKEVALINGEKWLSFDVQPTGPTGKAGKWVLMVFPYRSVLQIRDGKLQRDSSLLAVAEEGSSKWYVIDASGLGRRSVRIFVPGYSGVPAIPQAVTKMIKAE